VFVKFAARVEDFLSPDKLTWQFALDGEFGLFISVSRPFKHENEELRELL
jgi:hypothetical protein